MLNIFDVANGTIHVGDQLTLRAGVTPQELIAAGLVFVSELDMKTGWVFRTAGPISIESHAVLFSLGFRDNELRKVSLGFVENPGLDLEALFNEHNAFLRQELGDPISRNDRQSLYEYAWGEIVSEMDPRGGGSSIWVGWNTL